MNIEKLGRIVRKNRGDKGLREAARELGISPTTLCRIENGHIPDIKTLNKVCSWVGYRLTITNEFNRMTQG